MMTNSITIAGRLVEDAELRYSSSGGAVCSFTIANNRNYKNNERSTFIDVVIFGAYAESMVDHLTKGTAIDVTGELIQESWEHEGKNYYKHKILAKELDFRTPKNAPNKNTAQQENQDLISNNEYTQGSDNE